MASQLVLSPQTTISGYFRKRKPSDQEGKVVLGWQFPWALENILLLGEKHVKFSPPRSPTKKVPGHLNSLSTTTKFIRKQVAMNESSQKKQAPDTRIRTTKGFTGKNDQTE